MKATAAGQPSGGSVEVTTNASGVATAVVVADSTPGLATITASAAGGSGNTQVKMTGYDITLAATPDKIAADGHASGLVTATLRDGDGALASGKSVTLSTDRGTLLAANGAKGTSVTGATNSQGDYFGQPAVHLDTGTAHVPRRASRTEARRARPRRTSSSKGYQDLARPRAGQLPARGEQVRRRIAPGRRLARRLEATAFGLTTIPVTAKLSMGSATDAATIGDKTDQAELPQRRPADPATSGSWRSTAAATLTQVVTDNEGQANSSWNRGPVEPPYVALGELKATRGTLDRREREGRVRRDGGRQLPAASLALYSPASSRGRSQPARTPG